jgi:hypothetical protein
LQRPLQSTASVRSPVGPGAHSKQNAPSQSQADPKRRQKARPEVPAAPIGIKRQSGIGQQPVANFTLFKTRSNIRQLREFPEFAPSSGLEVREQGGCDGTDEANKSSDHVTSTVLGRYRLRDRQRCVSGSWRGGNNHSLETGAIG